VTDASGAADGFGLMIRLLPSQVVLGVIGEVDMVTAPDLKCLLGALIDRGHTDVVLDLANLDFLDSSGLQAIEDTAARLRPSRGVLRIRSPSARTRWLLDLSEVSGLVEFEPSDPDLVPLGSEHQAGDNATIVSAAAHRTADVGWATVMPAGHDVADAALELVTALAQATVGGADGASVSLARHGQMGTVAATDDTVAQMDRDQYATGQGPCLAAAGEGHRFHVESVAEEARWPDFVPRARAGGIGSILSTPLMATAGRSVGALNIYSRTERAFGPPEQELAALFASQASRIVASEGVAAEQATRLQAALRVRELIAQAQGVVMARQGVSAEAASASLLRSSRQAHISLRRQATEITASTQRQIPLTRSEP